MSNLPPGERSLPPVVVEVWGAAALFTRPEAKTERQTYAVMTPSAAVGILESIFWKPEFAWRVERIEVLAPIVEGTVRRNETSQVVTMEGALNGMRVDTAANRTQRASTFLKDVRYRIHAQVELRSHATDTVAKYRDQFRRRVDRGACFSQPYLGTREFVAMFGPPTEARPIEASGDLGVMVHSAIHAAGKPTRWTYFTARLDRGVLHVPTEGIGS